MNDSELLKKNAKDFSILYVEDNDSLRENASKLLKKFFPTVYVAADGKEGLALFKEHHPALVISDIKMPKLDGMLMSKHIKHIAPDTKIIIMSAFDEKDYLYQAIEIGVFRFLKKPVTINELSSILHKVILEIKHEQRVRLFQAQLGNIFNYQSSMVGMLKERKPIIVNQPMLDFYEVEDISELNNTYDDIGNKFLKHDGFLYNSDESNWLDKVLEDKKKLFNIKMKNSQNEMCHFVLKCQDIPDKDNYEVISFDDITELNLLKLFDGKATKKDISQKNTKSLFDLLKVIQRNSAKIALHNYYKGISITNDAVIAHINDNSVEIKAQYTQEKAIQYERKCLITSETLPSPILCEEVVKIAFDRQVVEFTNLSFVTSSPIQRETIRLVPEDTHKVTLFIGDSKHIGDISIEDISIESTRLKLSVNPEGLNIDDEAIIDMVFILDKRPLIINTKAILFKKYENKRGVELVFIFKLEPITKASLIKYITKRQMAIIREFKGKQNG
jgi:YesN/AraC family two-component response regulator